MSEKFILINSITPIKKNNFKLNDLKSRIDSFIHIGIDLPTDELLKVVISKYFSEKQIYLNPKISNFIIKNVDRSYEKMFKFIQDLDQLLSSENLLILI